MSYDYSKYKELRNLDIFISEHLFNNPCKLYWWVSNNDGVEMVEYFTCTNEWRKEEQKEPLYELKEGDLDYHDNLEEYEKQFDDKEENWKDGVHRWNLKVIPEYHKDLNLINQCEKKLYEKGLVSEYIDQLAKFSNDEPDMKELSNTDWFIFVMVNMSSEIKTRAIVETLKGISK